MIGNSFQTRILNNEKVEFLVDLARYGKLSLSGLDRLVMLRTS